MEARAPLDLPAGVLREPPQDPESGVEVVRGGLDAVREAREGSDRRILALVEDADRRTVTALLDAGADGIALSGEAPEALAHALSAIAAGFVVVPAVARQALRRPVLTARQKQILGLLVLGTSNAEIARRLFLAEATVKTHLTQVFAKLGVKSRTEAIDLILDPVSGLGTGILGIREAEREQVGYGRPTVGGG